MNMHWITILCGSWYMQIEGKELYYPNRSSDD